jgi:Kef-type K+ transport system membrane component KefB
VLPGVFNFYVITMVTTIIIAGSEAFGRLNLVLLFGFVILGGTFGSRVFQKLRIPQVVGCIVVGVVLGEVLGVVSPATIESLEPFTMFALGLIGFMIGAELRGDVFRKHGRQFRKV